MASGPGPARHLSSRWELRRDEGLLRGVDLLVYVDDVEHGMTNDGKPTVGRRVEGRIEVVGRRPVLVGDGTFRGAVPRSP